MSTINSKSSNQDKDKPVLVQVIFKYHNGEIHTIDYPDSKNWEEAIDDCIFYSTIGGEPFAFDRSKIKKRLKQ